MKKVYFLLLTILFAAISNAQNVNVNPGAGSYATLQAAFTAINAGTHTGAITVDIVGNTTETATAVLNASGSGSASYTSITISPSGGVARTISGAITAGNPLIDFSGADNVTIDGLNTGGNSLTIANTTVSATSGTSTIRFIGGATSNTITNCNVQGSGTMSVATNGAVIFFSTDAVTANGNDNNTISNCNIGPAGSNLPTKGILGNGSTSTTAIGNSGIVITNNNIFDYFGAAVTSSGIAVNGGCNTWTITNNRFYQTATRTWTTGAAHRAIDLNSSTSTSGVQGFTVTGNIIGYATNSQTGVYTLTGAGTGAKFIGISVNGISNGTTSTVSNNTVSSISMTGVSGSGTSTSSPFMGMLLQEGNYISNDNTIGSQSATGSLTFSTTTTSATDVYGIYNFTSNAWTSNNNNIGGLSVTNLGASGTFLIYGMRAFTSSTVAWNASNNLIGGTVSNSIQLTGTGTASQVVGMFTSLPGGNLTSNTIRNLTSNIGTGTTSGASVIGINITSGTPNHTVSQNTIFNLSNSNTTTASVVTGLQFTGGTANIVQRNLIYDLTVATNSTSAEVNGIRVAGGTTNYRNNIIRLGIGITNAIGTGSTTGGISGINGALGTDNFYHNSVYIGGAPSAGVGPSYAFNSAQTVNTRSFRNNIFFNARNNSGATGKNYIVRVGGTAANPAGLTINNNIYFSSGSGSVFGYFNSLDVADLTAWKAAVGQDAGSVFSDPQFLNPTAAVPDLHIHPTNPTTAEGNGVDVGVADDFDGQTRSGLTPVDIGADAGNFITLDAFAPAITYTLLNNTLCLSNPSLTVNITDISGVNTTIGTRPRIWFKKSTNANVLPATNDNTTDGWKYVEASNAASPFNFSINYGLISGGVGAGDIIQYFVVAQDNSVTPNVGINIGTFTGTPASVALAAGNFPIGGAINSYTILSGGLSGAVTVGAAGTYTTLTGAGGLFATLNAGGLTGNLTVTLLDATQTEGGANALNSINYGCGGPFNLTITPAPTVAVTITGSNANAILKLNGADNVTIDGLNTGGSSLLVTNTNAAGLSELWIGSANATDGALNNTIRNTNFAGLTNSVTVGGIVVGSGTTLGSPAESPNNNLTIQGCNFIRQQNGIYMAGNTVSLDQNTIITQNTFGSTVAADKLTFRGLSVQNVQNFTISDNTIAGVTSTTSSSATVTGISVFGLISGGNIFNNKISDIKQNNTTGWGSNGIGLFSTSTGINLNVYNNFVSDVASQGFNDVTATDNGYGIMVASGAGYNIYYNTVHLNTNQGTNAATGITAAINLASGLSVGSVNLRNNILGSSQTVGANRYAILSSSANTAFSAINYNDYYTSGPNLGFIGSNRVDLAAVIAGFGSNANSINATPVYISATNLHLDPSVNCLLNAKATPIGTITTDIDGNTRHALTPDVGADEFTSATEPAITPGTNPAVCVGAASANLTYSAATNSPDQYSIDFDAAAEAQGFVDVINAALPASPIVITVTGSVPGTYNAVLNVRNSTTGCVSNGYAITVTVNPNNTITLTSAPGTNNQTVCINTSITNITYATTTATGATFSGLPAGVTGLWAANVVTISGTPTTSVGSPFNYTVTLTGGGSCGTLTATGTITVTPDNTITLTSAPGTNNQTVCINTPITNITYATTGATGATFSGLPAGVTGNWAANVVTISGSPTTTVGSPFSYTVTLTGGCGTVTATGTITVTPDNTITLTSAAGTDAQSVCINTPITNIMYATTGATGATFSGLPSGVTGNWAANVVTISGLPTTTIGSPFGYTVTLTGGCGTITATGTITVTSDNTITLTSAAGTDAQSVCLNSAISNITYATTGATGATFSGLPAGVTGNWAANVVTISGTPTTTVGSPFSYTVTLTGGCGTVTATGTITVRPLPTITSTQVEPTTCASADGSINITVAGAAGPYTFAWTGSGVNPTSEDQTGLTVGSYSVTVTSSNGCSETISFGLAGPGGCSICPTIPTFATTPSGGACAGSNVTLTASGLTDMGSTYGIIFKYSATALADPYTGGTVIATVANGALTSAGTVATANSSTIPVGSYIIYAILTPTPVDPGCRPAAQTNLTIGTVPDVNQPANQAVCNNTATAPVNFSGSVPGTVFNWTNSDPSIGLAASGTGDIASFTATNATTNPVVATVTVTPSFSSVAGPTSITMPGQSGTNSSNVRGYFFTAPVNFNITSLYVPTDASAGNQSIAVVRFNGNTPPPVFSATTNAFTTLFLTQNDATVGNIPVNIPIGAGEVIGIMGYRGTINSYGNGSGGITIAGNPVSTTRMGMQFPLTTTIPQDIWQEPSSTNISRVLFEYTVAGPTCTGTPKSFTITVNPTPSATITYAGSPYCSNGGTATVTRAGTAGGTYSSTAGLTLNATTGDVTLGTSTPGTYTVTYTIAAAGGCAAFSTTTTITITQLPAATINYAGSPYCSNAGTATVTRTGTAGGAYSATPAGLSLNTTTGDVTLGTSTAGTYTVTYTIAAAGGCPVVTATANITVTQLPVATISYAGSPYCTSSGTATVTRTGTAGGTYSATPAGLTLNASTGDVTLATSTPGTYTVTYTIAAAGGCPAVTATASITVTAANAATISYAGTPYCTTVTSAPVTRTGTAGGTYSAPAGLSINASTGTVNPSLSTAGTYTVTYTMAATGGCPAATATTTITITQAPNMIIFYAGTPYCSNAGTATVSLFGTTGGTYSATPAGLSINATTGAVTLATSTAGTYTVTYSVTAAGCGTTITQTTITVTAAPNATIAYAGSPYCSNAGTATVTFTGTPSGGTYSSTAGLSLNPTTGAVTPGTSTPGTYTVTYSVAAAGGCGAYTTTATITITQLPAATIAYTGTPYCSNAGTANVTRTGTAGGTYTATPAGLSINATTGVVNLGASTAGAYTVTYTLAAGGGCPAVITTTTITITALPASTIAYAGTPFCQPGGIATVTRTGTAGGTYSASPAGLTINATSGDINVTTSTPGTYTVTYTLAAAGGCGVVTATTTVTINAPSVAPTGATASSTSLCGSGPVALSVVGGTLGSGTWRWYTGSCGGTLAGSGATLNVTPTVTTTYYVRAENPCGNTTCASVTVTVNTVPTISITTSATTIKPGQPATLTATVSPAGTSITWYRDGIQVPGATGTTLIVDVADYGIYTARATTGASCTALSNGVTITPERSSLVFVYPNPSAGQFQVRIFNPLGKLLILEVYNSAGQRVYQETKPTSAPYTRMDVDMRKAASGDYIIRIVNNEGTEIGSKPIIISH